MLFFDEWRYIIKTVHTGEFLIEKYILNPTVVYDRFAFAN
jgi:hypothetical protein